MTHPTTKGVRRHMLKLNDHIIDGIHRTIEYVDMRIVIANDVFPPSMDRSQLVYCNNMTKYLRSLMQTRLTEEAISTIVVDVPDSTLHQLDVFLRTVVESHNRHYDCATALMKHLERSVFNVLSSSIVNGTATEENIGVAIVDAVQQVKRYASMSYYTCLRERDADALRELLKDVQ